MREHDHHGRTLSCSGSATTAVGEGAEFRGEVPIVVKAPETAVKLRRLAGLGVSRTSDYVKAPPHMIEEFLTHPKGL
jgi:allantoin racemase